MLTQDRRFLGRAWDSLASTKNTAGKVILIVLLQFIPILGQIVLLAYSLGWLREAAWRMETPMPHHVMGYGDPDFWGRGVKAFFAEVLLAIIASLVYGLTIALESYLWLTATSSVTEALIIGLFTFFQVLFAIFICIVSTLGLVRLSIYNSFGAFWQWGKCLSMAARDFGGLVKLALQYIGVNLLLSLFNLLVIAITLGVLGFAGYLVFSGPAPVLVDLPDAMGFVNLESVLATLLSLTLPVMLISIVIGICFSIPGILIGLLFWRALGNWTAGLEVSRWGSMQDPLPDLPARTGTAPAGSQQSPAAQNPAVPGQDVQTGVDAASPADSGQQAGGSSVDTGYMVPAGTALVAARPEKRGHPLALIIVSYLLSILLCFACFGIFAAGLIKPLSLAYESAEASLGAEQERRSGTQLGAWDLWGTWSFNNNQTVTLGTDASITISDGINTYTGTYTFTPREATVEERDSLLDWISRNATQVDGVDNVDEVWIRAYDVTVTYQTADGQHSSSGLDASMPQTETVSFVIGSTFLQEYALLINQSSNSRAYGSYDFRI